MPIGTLTSSPEELNSRNLAALVDVDVVGGIDCQAPGVGEFRGDGLCADQFAGAVEGVAFDGSALFVEVEVTVGGVDRNAGGRDVGEDRAQIFSGAAEFFDGVIEGVMRRRRLPAGSTAIPWA